ncbi:MAG: hypothetical protein LUC45_02740 [Paraprevotella sp.]|nr:hypothetical protein [Paraprevotella sp.]
MGDSPWEKLSEWEIVVTPPLWATWWAYTLYILVALAMTYAIIERYIAGRRARMVAE